MSKKVVITSIVIGAIAMMSATSAFASTTSTTTATQSQYFTAQQPLTPEMKLEIAAAEQAQKFAPMVPKQQAKLTITPNVTTQKYWSYTDIWPGNYIDTSTSYEYNVPTTESVSITLVQYPEDYSEGSCNDAYQLINQGGGSNSSMIGLQGNYDSQNVTLTFYNVQAGTYRLRIMNNSSTVYQDGNGWTTYNSN